MIGFDSGAERRGFWRGVLVGLVAAGMIAACMAPPAHAQTPDDLGPAFASARSSDGSTITLYLGRGVCVGKALMAAWASPDGGTKVPGCWVLFEDSVVLVSFLDGERGNIPVGHLVRTQSL